MKNPPSLAAFQSAHLNLPSYPQLCALAKSGRLMGVQSGPHGYGWQVTDPESLLSSIRTETERDQ